MTKETIIDNLIQDRISVLIRLKRDLEEQITKDTGNEINLPEAFADQRREKLAETNKRT